MEEKTANIDCKNREAYKNRIIQVDGQLRFFEKRLKYVFLLAR